MVDEAKYLTIESMYCGMSWHTSHRHRHLRIQLQRPPQRHHPLWLEVDSLQRCCICDCLIVSFEHAFLPTLFIGPALSGESVEVASLDRMGSSLTPLICKCREQYVLARKHSSQSGTASINPLSHTASIFTNSGQSSWEKGTATMSNVKVFLRLADAFEINSIAYFVYLETSHRRVRRGAS